jgi:lysophospholipase L1-like esterase
MRKLIFLLFMPCMIVSGQMNPLIPDNGQIMGGSPSQIGMFRGGAVYQQANAEYDYNSYSDSLFTVMTDLTTAEKRKIDSLFVRLDEYGTADKLDVLNIQIVDSSKYSLLNWVNKNHYPVKSGLPTFTANVGYRTTTDKYINTTFNPSIDGVNFTVHNASFGVWVYKDTVNTTGLDFGARKSTATTTRTSLIVTSSDKNSTMHINNRSSSPTSLISNNGLYSISMTGDTAKGYKNGSYKSVQVSTSPILDNLDFYLGCYNLDGTASNYSKRIYSGYFIGGGLRDWDMKIIYDAVADYAESKGVNIIYRSDSLNVVCDGNSLTKGTAGPNEGKKYPQFLQDSLRSVTKVDTVYNLGVDSQSAQDMDSADTDIEAKWSAFHKRNIVIAWEITNSLWYGATAQGAIDELKTYCLHQKRRGFEVVVLTCLPRGNINADSINIANTLLRSQYLSFADKLVDLTTSPELNDYTNETYWFGDHIHLKEAGYKIVAKRVFDAIKNW